METKIKFKSVDEYLASQPDTARRVLTRIRRIIGRAMPRAEETISYNIPAYRLHGRVVLYFAGWKEHYSLYPSTARLGGAFKKALARYEISKGTIRFPLSEPVPAELIEGIARFRASEFAPGKDVGRRSRAARTRRRNTIRSKK